MAQHTAELENPFSIDPDGELPIGLQLTWRLRALIATGSLVPGERLPSFRRLADWAGVNVNTVRTVYAGLEAEGLVVTKQGQGTFVAEGTKPTPELEDIVSEALRRAKAAGVSAGELAIVATACAEMEVDEVIGSDTEQAASAPSTEPNGAIEVRHELRRQIARLEGELASYARDIPPDMPTARRRAAPHLAGIEELERTRDTLIAQLSEAQKAAERRARQEGEARVRRSAMLASLPAAGGSRLVGRPLARAMSRWRAKS